jgi:hypothetical protein
MGYPSIWDVELLQYGFQFGRIMDVVLQDAIDHE